MVAMGINSSVINESSRVVLRTLLLLMTCVVMYAHGNSYIFVELIPEDESS